MVLNGSLRNLGEFVDFSFFLVFEQNTIVLLKIKVSYIKTTFLKISVYQSLILTDKIKKLQWKLLQVNVSKTKWQRINF